MPLPLLPGLPQGFIRRKNERSVTYQSFDAFARKDSFEAEQMTDQRYDVIRCETDEHGLSDNTGNIASLQRLGRRFRNRRLQLSGLDFKREYEIGST